MTRYTATFLIAIGLIGSQAGRLPAAVPSIMPLGDSITEGLGSNSPGGYRTQLYNDFNNANIPFAYVGTSTTNNSTTLITAGQTSHEGHGGYRVDQIANNLDGSDGTQSPSPNNGGFWFPGGNGTGRAPITPSIVLLHIGTNDILQNASVGPGATTLAARLDALVNQITTDRPNAELFLSNLIPINSSANTTVMQYNALIQNVIVPKYDALGRHVFFVDQYSNFVDSNGNVIGSLLADGIHPTQAGYDMMGNTWFSAIEAVPEPSSVLLLALGLLALVAYRWQRLTTCAMPAVAIAGRPRAKSI